MTTRLLVVADSESFLKWGASTLDSFARDDPSVVGRVVVIRGPLEPSAEQTRAAVAGTGVTQCPVVGRRALARLVRTYQPDAVLVAATGPVAEMVARGVLRASDGRPPVLLSGPPGMAMAAASTEGVKWRHRWCDLYIVHSPREAALFAQAFERYGANPRIAVTRLPFLAEPAAIDPTDGTTRVVHRVVFAPQSIVPHRRADRVAILEGLAALRHQGFDVVVKQRVRSGERQTHHEALPYDQLWQQEHARLDLATDSLRFESGPMRDWLTQGSALVTVSSTAALEAMALGVPAALISDFGVAAQHANEVYEGSGCLVSMADLGAVLRDGGPVPDSDWLAANYLHAVPSELGSALRDLTASQRQTRAAGESGAPRPVSMMIAAYSALKSDIPALWYPAKWFRTVVGRFIQLR